MDLKMLSKGNVLVFGDVILDKYISGNVDRVSPEAPVPVLKPSKEEIRLLIPFNSVFKTLIASDIIFVLFIISMTKNI